MSTLRWGLIGCGDVARKRVAKAIQDESRSELVAACRRDGAQLQQFCRDFDIPRSYQAADQLIADEDVDAVYIATPVRDHLPQAIAAARAGKHVLVEKPMGLSVAECDSMIAACRDAGVKLGVAYYRPFYAIVERIAALVAEGAIGTPLNVSAMTATLPMDPDAEGYWRVAPAASGGGALMDIGSHRINLFQQLFGEISDVRAICGTVAATYDAEDTAVLSLRFATGMTGTLQCHFGCDVDPDEFTVTGTLGRLAAKPLNGDTLAIETKAGTRTECHPPPDNLCGPLVADFASAVLDDRPPAITGEAGRDVNAIIAAAYGDSSHRPQSS